MRQRKPLRTKQVYLLDKHHKALVQLAARENKNIRQTMDELLDLAFTMRRIPVSAEVKE